MEVTSTTRRRFHLLGLALIAFLVWAALHDILQGERDLALEYLTLLVCVPSAAFLIYRLLRPSKIIR